MSPSRFRVPRKEGVEFFGLVSVVSTDRKERGHSSLCAYFFCMHFAVGDLYITSLRASCAW